MISNLKIFSLFITPLLFVVSLPFCKAGFTQDLNGIGDTIDVVHYNIYIDSINYDENTIKARAGLRLTTKIDLLDHISLELLDLSVDEVFLNEVELEDFTHNSPLLYIPLPGTISTGDTIILDIHYNGNPFHEGWGGYHWSGNYSFNLGVGFVSDPHNLGKAWFPCVDDFTDRATYNCYITVAEGHKAVCGGELIEITDNGNNTSTYHWQLEETIPTYLASVATGNYWEYTDTYNGIERDIPVNIFVRPVDSNDVVGSFATLNEITAIFEEHFGPYPFNRIGYVGTSIGAMEHATNIAYPNSGINGNLDYEWLIAHELSHMWFGDCVTCADAGDMWLNEGWATFCEFFYREILYSPDEFKSLMRENHADVLHYCHTGSGDGSYLPLYGLPHAYTYGMTAYDKGATVVQSMRAYLGDSVFFDAVTAYVQEFAFNHASSYDMRDFISDHTGTDMTAFFDAWVFTGGTPHFSIDSFAVQNNGNNFMVDIYPRQKHKGVAHIDLDNIIEVTLMDNDWNSFTDTVHFSGPAGHSMLEVPFEPTAVFIDPEERMCDATTDSYKIIKESGNYSFPETYCSIKVNDITDSAFLQVVHNWAAPDSMFDPLPGLSLSPYRYWTIEGILPENFDATAKLMYNRFDYLDNDLIESEQDSVVILYRPDAREEWQEIEHVREGIWSVGYIYVDAVPGQYTLAVWDTQYVGKKENDPEKPDVIRIFPNPVSDILNIRTNLETEAKIEIFSSQGAMLDVIPVNAGEFFCEYKTAGLRSGTYHLLLVQNGKYVSHTPFIVY